MKFLSEEEKETAFNKIRMMFSREDSSFPRYLFIADERVTILRSSERVYLMQERKRAGIICANFSKNKKFAILTHLSAPDIVVKDFNNSSETRVI